MAEVKKEIVICGIICLMIIYVFLIVFNRETAVIGNLVVGVIGCAIGAIAIKTPKIDNKRGVLKW